VTQDSMTLSGSLGKTKLNFILIDKAKKIFYKKKAQNIHLFINANKHLFLKTVYTLMSLKLYGVNKGFFITLEILGIGLKLLKKAPNSFQMLLGFSHSVFLNIDKEIKPYLVNSNKLVLFALDFFKIKQCASSIKKIKQEEKYKKKGINFR
jgi:ribosomal protein L6P/L9E